MYNLKEGMKEKMVSLSGTSFDSLVQGVIGIEDR